ncbi:unnamed protein product [Adineta steineri]|uniref:G-protein coupled receptors family 1 profile domain-containing protein n=1 Tax=Adineta steineri TaxID=433720 RepID=A0A816BJZ8_9BILA|nr:unnamed protein product [Adineta steineri]CAF1608672.1 unnamed protein product [Adineta steineri]
MSASNTTISSDINGIYQRLAVFVQFYAICLFFFGAVGNTLSIYVLTRPTFRSNSCACYLLASTLSGCGSVYINIPLRLLQQGYGIDAHAYSIPVCQFLNYIQICIRALPIWFVVLASIDRSSSVTLRGWSNIRVAYRVIPITVVFVFLIYIHEPFNVTLVLPQRMCLFATSTYRLFFGIWDLIFWSSIPTSCMLCFGLLTIRHIRQGMRRVQALNTQNHSRRRQSKTDHQLIQMLLIQSFVLCSTTIVLSIGNLYISITSINMVKTALQTAEDTYLLIVLNWVATAGPCMNFYLFILSSQLFRHELINLLRWRQPVLQVN